MNILNHLKNLAQQKARRTLYSRIAITLLYLFNLSFYQTANGQQQVIDQTAPREIEKPQEQETITHSLFIPANWINIGGVSKQYYLSFLKQIEEATRLSLTPEMSPDSPSMLSVFLEKKNIPQSLVNKNISDRIHIVSNTLKDRQIIIELIYAENPTHLMVGWQAANWITGAFIDSHVIPLEKSEIINIKNSQDFMQSRIESLSQDLVRSMTDNLQSYMPSPRETSLQVVWNPIGLSRSSMQLPTELLIILLSSAYQKKLAPMHAIPFHFKTTITYKYIGFLRNLPFALDRPHRSTLRLSTQWQQGIKYQYAISIAAEDAIFADKLPYKQTLEFKLKPEANTSLHAEALADEEFIALLTRQQDASRIADSPKVVKVDRAWAYLDKGRGWGLRMNDRLKIQGQEIYGHVVGYYTHRDNFPEAADLNIKEGAIVYIREGQRQVKEGMEIVYDPQTYP